VEIAAVYQRPLVVAFLAIEKILLEIEETVFSSHAAPS